MDFRLGDRVVITNTKESYSPEKRNTVGYEGIISRTVCNNGYDYCVKLNDGRSFCYYSYELMGYIKTLADLQILDREKENLNCRESVRMDKVITDASYYVGVKFGGYNVTYDFAVKDLPKALHVDDLVVCDTSRGFSVGKVVDLKHSSSKATKFIVQEVDLTAHKARLEKQNKASKLMQEMRERGEALKEIEKFRSLAINDEVMAQLVRQYEDLNS